MAKQRDLALAYSPGVSVSVLAITADPAAVYDYAARAIWSWRSSTGRRSWVWAISAYWPKADAR